jgi:hypothetical protein
LLRLAAVGAVLAVVGCSRREAPPPAPVAPVPADGKAADTATKANQPWPELAEFPIVAPLRVIELPARPDVPRFEVGGPVIAGDVAVVASSQFGFAAVDWRRGQIAWTKPAGEHVAPPLVRDADVVLIGECVAPPDVPDGEHLLGCLRVVTRAGVDHAYLAIHGKEKKVAAFAAEAGVQQLWNDAADNAVRWQRGDQAVTIDVATGVATPASAPPPPLVLPYKDKRCDVAYADGKLVATEKGRELWAIKRTFAAVLGVVPGPSPMVRVAQIGASVGIHDIDATGSVHEHVAKPAPGIQLLGWVMSSLGAAALAVRLDSSLRRDYVAGYAANALLVWVWPLPDTPRADPVGVAIAPDAVVVFHDGDTFTVLPELSAPPTAPGAARAASQNPTP